ncbi:hypothetical protein X769_09935 [Mesorhizobium sp. LSJC268A00]|uniref:hypothetical protein n=1 Tax=unclassified Mesorhizobium TaxID=325217 RepID=UPI0003CEB43A|nr:MULTISPECIES: hypothetical protein [unclassified Mesorhizobium]ESW93867.1 hypothetical protein X770_03045 [Mesorhizobium sp. LSJC269B00]ESX07297.1 hypothetical protein X769_09935 [Mesorhizobium sp. LSJC268A00]ESZ09319.1 hypothetical protein X736_04300 [Mesorhizobium sp. L2C089B000]ESZ17564.1 hypothetical protein X735_01950 [Mesorhizobium sp. L2C085B000]ESZ45947.1 hypothetical protein X730_20940 [Mesorhizobium sp. L103C565B0]
MIFYVAHREHAYTQAVVLLYHRTDLEAWFRLVRYEDAGLLRGVRAGVVIWSDMDRLTSDELSRAAGISAELADNTGLTQLNHPTASLQRFDLLRLLHADGSNAFRVFRPDELEEAIRYPVFIRDETGALYREPPLLHDRPALDAAIARLDGSDLVRPMVVEMIGTPGMDGYFRKYAAFRVGDTIYGQHCAMSKSWFVKNSPEQLLPAHIEEIRTYVDTNPDANAVMQVFEKARMQYGRIDYTFVDGRLVVFEINSNPTVLSDPPTPFAIYDPKPFADLQADALLALPQATEADSLAAIDTAHQSALAKLRRHYQMRRLKLTLRKVLRKRK